MSMRLSDVTRREELLGELENLGRALPREEIPGFLGELERVRVSVLVSVSAVGPATPVEEKRGDRLLTVAETAGRLGRSTSWVYKNKHALPIAMLPTGGYGFSEKGLERWIARRAT